MLSDTLCGARFRGLSAAPRFGPSNATASGSTAKTEGEAFEDTCSRGPAIGTAHPAPVMMIRAQEEHKSHTHRVSQMKHCLVQLPVNELPGNRMTNYNDWRSSSVSQTFNCAPPLSPSARRRSSSR